ncbi:MAG: AraC family transcriptional regulator [Eubacteriales bacterium]|nr:AraC family transcriptional regulator [Eubacteriales bacterium]
MITINPYVRYAARCLGNTVYEKLVSAYDFRLFYGLKGIMTAEFSDHKIEMRKYSLLVIPHSVPYRLIIGSMKTEYFNINFDLDSGHTEISPQRPDPSTDFDPRKVVSEHMVEEFNKIIAVDEAYSLEAALSRIAEEKYMGIPSGYLSDEIASAYLKEVLITALQMKKNLAVPSLIREISDYIGDNFNKPVTNGTIAAHFKYHPYYLNRIFQKATGKTMRKYLIDLRLKEAARMLVSGNSTISEVAAGSGFETPSYFTEYFKAVYGMTPLKYRMHNRIY